MGTFNAKEYVDALAMLDDPDIDAETRAVLKQGADEFQRANPANAARILARETGDLELNAMADRLAQFTQLNPYGGDEGIGSLDIDKPRSGDEYVKKKALLEDYAVERRENTERAKQNEWSRIQPTTLPEATARGIESGLRGFEEQYPQEIPEQGKRATGGQVLFDASGEPYVSGGATEALGEIEAESDKARLELGLIEIDESLPSASKRTNLYAPPEFIPRDAGFAELATAHYHLEPPVELARAALRTKLGSRADELTLNSEEYRRFADALWMDAYERAEQSGKPAVRVDYMNDEGWLAKTAKYSAKVMGKGVAPAVFGADRSITGGLLTEATAGAADKLLGVDHLRRDAHELQENAPIATGAGAILGALAPGGLTGRIYSGLAGRVAPAGSGVGRRLLGGAAGGMVAGGAESLASDAVRNLGEAALAESPEYSQLGDVAERAGYSAGAGALFGPMGEMIGVGAGKAVKALREGRRGPALANAERIGMTTGVAPAIRKTPDLEAIDEFAAVQGRRPLDVLAETVADPMAAQGLKRQQDVIAGQAAENQAYYGSRAGKKELSADRLTHQLLDEVGGLFDKTGKAVPLASTERKELGQLASELIEVRAVPAGEAGKVVKSYGRGARTRNGDDVLRLLDQLPELAPAVRQARIDAVDQARGAAPKPKGRSRKRTAKELLLPGPEDIAVAPTQRDTMLPPPTQGGTMRSPPMPGTSKTMKSPEVPVQERAPDPEGGVAVTELASGEKLHVFDHDAMPELENYRYVVGPRKMSAEQLQGVIRRLEGKLDETKGSSDPFKRLLAAAMQTRDKFPLPGQEPMRKGGTQLGGYSAMKAEQEAELRGTEFLLKSAGLPQNLKPRPEPADSAGLPLPQLSATERAGFIQGIEKFRSAPGREAKDAALLQLAQSAGLERELNRIAASKAFEELKSAASLGALKSNPFEVIGLRADPMMRALSKRPPRPGEKLPPLSPDLRDLLRRLAGGKRRLPNPLDPLGDIYSAAGRASASRLGPMGAAGEHQREQLGPEELEILKRLVEVSQQAGRYEAAAGAR